MSGKLPALGAVIFYSHSLSQENKGFLVSKSKSEEFRSETCFINTPSVFQKSGKLIPNSRSLDSQRISSMATEMEDDQNNVNEFEEKGQFGLSPWGDEVQSDEIEEEGEKIMVQHMEDIHNFKNDDSRIKYKRPRQSERRPRQSERLPAIINPNMEVKYDDEDDPFEKVKGKSKNLKRIKQREFPKFEWNDGRVTEFDIDYLKIGVIPRKKKRLTAIKHTTENLDDPWKLKEEFEKIEWKALTPKKLSSCIELVKKTERKRRRNSDGRRSVKKKDKALRAHSLKKRKKKIMIGDGIPFFEITSERKNSKGLTTEGKDFNSMSFENLPKTDGINNKSASLDSFEENGLLSGSSSSGISSGRSSLEGSSEEIYMVEKS